MSTKPSTFSVQVLILCLTICQFSVGQADTDSPSYKRKAARRPSATRSRNMKSIADSSDDQGFSTPSTMSEKSRLEGTELSERGWLTSNETLMFPVPKSGMIITSAALGGTISQAKVSGKSSGIQVSGTYNTSSFGPDLTLQYGFTNNFFIGTTVEYKPGRTDTALTLEGYGDSNSTSTDDGWREPDLTLGATAALTSSTRITGELSGRIPVGNAKNDTRGTNTKSNGLSGGGALTPKLTVVSKVAAVKLVSQLGYTSQFDRKSDDSTETKTTTSTSSGGNSVSLIAAVEIPNAYNLGIGGLYSKSESSTTSTFDSGVKSISTSSSNQMAGGLIYMGFEIPETNMIIMPRAVYLTPLDRERDGISYSRADTWLLGVAGIMHF